MDRVTLGCCGSVELTTTFFLTVLPGYPVVLTFRLIFPSPPGGICLGYEATVHPHPVLTRVMFKTAVPLF